MRNYKLTVKSQLGTSYDTLDLYDNVNIPVIFNVKDVREPQSIKTNYTKQFDIPASHINNIFFEGIRESGFSVYEFNPNHKVECQLMYDDNVIIDGYLQVIDVNKTDEDGYYSIVIYGELSSIFNELVGCKISDYDISEFNHKYTEENIKNSWDTSIQRNGLDIPFLKGRGYVYPLIWRGQQDENLKVEDFLPAVYIKTIWDKIFENTGKKYKSDFLNSDKFKSLILPYPNRNFLLSDEEKLSRVFNAEIDSSDFNDLGISGYKKFYTGRADIVYNSPKYKIKFPTKTDPNGLFFNGDTFIPKVKQNTSIAANICIKTIFRASTPQPSGFLITGPNNTGNVYVKNETTGQFIHSEPFEVIHETGIVGALGTDYVVEQSIFLDYTGLLEENNSYSVYIDFNQSAGPNASKFVNVLDQIIPGFIFNGVSTDVDCKTEIYSTSVQEWILEGDIVNMNQSIPNDITCVDFLKDINKMFNLYWVATDDDTFEIEPRETFYTSDDVNAYDWTEKFDRETEIKIIPLAELNNKQYLFTYNEDDDYYNETYTNKHKEIYGQREIVVNNDFVSGEEKIDVKFSSSPLVKFNNTNIVTTSFLTFEDGFFERKDVKSRILVYGGLVGGNTFKIKDTSYTQYPYAGHFDNPYSPTYDINWGQTKEYFYDWTLVPEDNLFNTYWKNFILDIISPDSHMLVGELHLTPLDILKLSIFDTIQVDNVFYKINKLEYDIFTENAKVELFKTFTYLNFPSKSVTSTGNSGIGGKPITEIVNGTFIPKPGWGFPFTEPYGGNSGTSGISPYPTNFGTWVNQTSLGFDGWYNKQNENLDTKGKTGNNTYSKGNLTTNINQNTYKKGSWCDIMGTENYVSPQALSISIKGNKNRVSDGVNNVSIMGNNNFIEAGVQNTSVIGDNLYITKSNSQYINGDIIEKGTTKQTPNFIGGMVNRTSVPYFSGDKIDLIKCPINSVQNTGGISRFNFINCGVDNSLEFLF